ncbi:MAG: hypothetical protein M3155_06650 [Actinomycetota bacterium]|nr:hypothetical protein [Actinomycetota bacterium]
MVALALALVAALMLLAACGGGGGGDATKVLNQTFAGGKKVRSGQLNLGLTINAKGAAQLGGPVAIKLSGPFQSQGPGTLPQFDFDLALNATAGRSFSAGAISTGNQGFLKLKGQAYQVPPNVFASFKQGYEQAQKQGQQRSNQSLSSFGVDPRKWLKDSKVEGDADVEGTTTTHVSAKVDVGKLLVDVNQILAKAGQLGLAQGRQLPSGITPQQRQTLGKAIKATRFDLYSGKQDHILRRMVVKISFDVPKSAQARSSGLTGGDLTFDLTLAKLNQPQTVTAPTATRPFSELAGQLRSVLGTGTGASGGSTGGSTGGGTTTTPGGTTTTPGGNAKAQQYLQCLQQAGGDVAKAQKCAALLNG